MKKQIGLAIVTLLSAALSFYCLKIGFLKPVYFVPGLLVLPVMWGISGFLIENTFVILITSLGSGGLFLLIWGFAPVYLLCATLIILALLWGFKKVNKEKQLRIKLLINEIVPKGIGWLFFVIAIIIAVGFYFSPTGQKLKEGIKIPSWASEKILSLAIPGFSQDLTVDETINLLVKREKDEPISPPVREQVLSQLGLGGLKLTGNEKIRQTPEVLDQLVGGRINQLIKGGAQYLPLLAALIIWQTLIFLNKFFLALYIFFDSIFYALLRAIGFVKIEKITIEKEVIKL